MAERRLLTGIAGGIIGAITAVIGIVWSVLYFIFLNGTIYPITLYESDLIGGSFYFDIYFVPYPSYDSGFSLFLVFSIIICTLLIVTSLLTSVGFSGLYEVGAGKGGVYTLIVGNAGIFSAALLILIATLTTTVEVQAQSVSFGAIWIDLLIAITQNWFYFKLGFFVLAVALIILGSASLYIRNMITNPALPTAAGIVSPLGAFFLIIGALVFTMIFGAILVLVGFIILTFFFIAWTVVFYSSR
ncbi:MAG: hypothetical protein ACETWM_01970 [Candidatus Lokiarchaeia archaeon]